VSIREGRSGRRAIEMQDRRLGKFYIDLDVINHQPETARLILRDVLVTEAHYAGESRFVYVGAHHDFDPIPVGTDIPYYSPEVYAGLVQWRKT
jgi:hypothetical protein